MFNIVRIVWIKIAIRDIITKLDFNMYISFIKYKKNTDYLNIIINYKYIIIKIKLA